MTSTRLDRLAVEKLFRVPQRRARQIMAGLKGLRVGNAAAVSREALIARLERPAATNVRERLLEDLSAGIAVRPGELRIAFCGAEDLAAQAARNLAGDGQRLARLSRTVEAPPVRAHGGKAEQRKG